MLKLEIGHIKFIWPFLESFCESVATHIGFDGSASCFLFGVSVITHLSFDESAEQFLVWCMCDYVP